MKECNALFQTADWKKEKHVPVIDAPATVEKGGWCTITVSVGKELAHPNKTEHHISWIDVYFLPDGAKFPYQIGRAEFSAHGASTEGPDTSGVYTHPAASFTFKANTSGTICAASYCTIHGLWQQSASLAVN